MGFEIIILFIIVLAALLLFISGVVSVDLTALLVMVSLMVSGILTPEEGLSGFSNTATVTVLALLILSEGLKSTGAVELLGDKMLNHTGKRRWSTLIIAMGVPALISAFINTTAVVAVFIPVMFRIAATSGIKVSTLLIPLSFSAMIGGASTMIGTSTNLLINSITQSYGLEKFKIFDLTLMGGVLFLTLVAYMVLIGGKWLVKDYEETVSEEDDPANYLTEIVIPEGSSLINKSLNVPPLIPSSHFHIMRVIRSGGSLLPQKVSKIDANDILVVKTTMKEIIRLNNNPNVLILTRPKTLVRRKPKTAINIFEALIAPNSTLIDRKIRDVDFLRLYGSTPLAVRKGGVIGDQKLFGHRMSMGDILLMEGASQDKSVYSQSDWVIIRHISKDEVEKHLYRKDKLAVSVVILAGVILSAVSNLLPIVIAAWLGVVLMILTGCITLKRAYQNIDWRVIFLLAGIIPLGAAMNKTGADQYIAHNFVKMASDASPAFVISALFILTTLLTGIISNQATAVLLVPIAIQIALKLSIPPEPLVIAILFGANSSFLTPVGYQTNAMVYGPGNYTFKDFAKVGGLLCLIFWLMATLLIPRLYM